MPNDRQLPDDYLINHLCKRVMAHGWKCGEMGYCSDECMVLGSFKCGAAVLGGLILMAMVIQDNPAVEACPVCLKYAYGSVHGMGVGKNDWLKSGEWMCNPCFDREKALREERDHPYR